MTFRKAGNHWLRLLGGFAAGLIWLAPSHTLGVTLQVLHSFEALPSTPLAGLIQNPDGSFTGTSYAGGNTGGEGGFGTIYRVTTNGTVTTEYSFGFNPADSLASSPRGPVIRGVDGNLYGTDSYGGDGGGGAVFQFTTNGVFNVLHAFDDGDTPVGSLTQDTNGYLYGVTFYGGDYGWGAIYRVTTAGVFTNLHGFTEGSDGAWPSAGLIQARDGNLYGTTSAGGTGGGGTVFQMTPSGSLKTLFPFAEDTNGAAPVAPLLQASDGNLYGTTTTYGTGGINGNGTVFRITTGGTLTTLASLDNNPAVIPPYPVSEAGLIQGQDGKIYGVGIGGDSYGEFFQVQTNSLPTNGYPTIFYHWQGYNGVAPIGLIQDPHGNFYGVTAAHGPDNNGTFFQVMTNGTLTNLSTFANTDGSHPVGSLALGPGGSLYGATYDGGEAVAVGSTAYLSLGTLYQWTNGTLVTLYDFSNDYSGNPDSGPLLGPDGNLYGTTVGDGTYSIGTVYQLVTRSNVLNTVITNLASGTISSPGGLFLGNDSDFYGQEWDEKNGLEFSVSTSGTMRTNFTFNGTNGSVNDYGPVSTPGVQTETGTIYGTTAGGGVYGYGTVFRLDTDGMLTTLHNFDGTNDQGGPVTGVILASDGNLYGTTTRNYAGVDFYGTVFRVTTNGVFTNLCVFNGTNGATPLSGLIQGADGNLYGTSLYGGANGFGTIFQVTTNGTLTALFSFDNSTGHGAGGQLPGGLVQAPDGWFYGATANGGPTGGGAGVLYRFNLANPFEFIRHALSGDTLSLTWNAEKGSNYQLQATASLRDPAWANVNGSLLAASNSVTTSVTTIPGAMKFYRVQELP